MKEFMYGKVFLPIMEGLFSTPTLLEFTDNYSKSSGETMAKLYVFLCSGGLKEPNDFFTEINVKHLMQPTGIP